ncbi:glycosyltransferase family 4 protein [Ferruginibacter sp.]
MTIVFTSYTSSPQFDKPELWLKRIEGYTGILEGLCDKHTVIGIEHINYEGIYRKNGVQYYFNRFKNKTVRFPWRLHGLVKKLQPDAVFINGFIFPLQIIQLRMRLGSKAKIIVLHRAEKPTTGYKKLLQRIAANCINAYLFASDEMGMEWVDAGIFPHGKKIKEVVQASSVFNVTGKSQAMQLTQTKGDPVFLWVGRLDANKDPLTVITAFQQYLQHQPSATLYMIYSEAVLLQQVKEQLSADTKSRSAIKLVGKVPHSLLQSWYNSADFIISGSHYEGSGVAVIEAMSCGCIPIVTNIKSFRRLTGPGNCGLLYEAGNEQELLHVLLHTRSMDREKERQKVLQQFHAELSFNAITKKIEGVMASL